MIERLRRIGVAFIWRIRCHTAGIKDFHSIDLDTEINLGGNGSIHAGRNLKTQKRVVLSAINGKLDIGDNVSFNRNDIVVCRDSIVIGDHCAFGPNVVIYDHDHIFGRDGIAVDEFNTAPIIIEDHCWIGANVTILRGTHVGKGSVIGAGAIIRGSIPPHTLVTGNREMVFHTIDDRDRIELSIGRK